MQMQSNVYKYFLAYTKKTSGTIKNGIFTRGRDGEKFEVLPSKLSLFLLQKYSPIIVFLVIMIFSFTIVSWLALTLSALTWSVSALKDKSRRYIIYFALFTLSFFALPFFALPQTQAYIYAMNYLFFIFVGLFIYLFVVDTTGRHFKTEDNQYFLSLFKSHPTKKLLIVFLSIFILSSPFAVFEFTQVTKSAEELYIERLKNKKVLFPIEKQGITKDGKIIILPPGDYKSEVIDNKVHFINNQNPNIQGFLYEKKPDTDVKYNKDQAQAIAKADAIIDGRYFFLIPKGIIYYDCDNNFDNCKTKTLQKDLKEIAFDGKTKNGYLYLRENNRTFTFSKKELLKAGAR